MLDADLCCDLQILSPGSTMPTASSNAIPPEHRLMEFPDWVQIREGFRKRPQHQCKVCSIRKTKIGQRSATRFYCEACSEGNKHVYLCDHIRPGNYRNNTATCHQIWHLMWKNGAERPAPRVGRGIQMRALGKKRRRRRKEGESKSNVAGDAEAGDSEDGASTAEEHKETDGDNDEVSADSDMGAFEL
ncbi:hypothetical protein PHMEG_00033136 [Phytophthora megakarya]|uniref:PiggyBac transposable element-derived protein 4 C-terminal zinc-ribbon domain-containing protein n=1 Tax=Phytophthora megakarya TaxID=4795 RepID=A0A225UU17_9STRA|nr:hypothetical protein PHMEG_00033136 [Phytophthora megakarya]